MSLIEDHALIGDTHSAGLVALDGSIDWLCLPRFDSPSCFAALLDDERGGRWRIAPGGEVGAVSRTYREDSMVLETTFSTASGSIVVTDLLAIEERSDPHTPRSVYPAEVVVRSVRGLSGTVDVAMLFQPRFDYGSVTPWFRRIDGAVQAIGGPDALDLLSPVPVEVDRDGVRAHFRVAAGDTLSFVAAYHRSHLRLDPGELAPPEDLIRHTDDFWKRWAQRCSYEGAYRDQLIRSLLTLKALTYSPTGGIVAAATTSLPEALGGPRNWDYRYCWLRDATFTLETLLDHGYTEEAVEWRDWLLRAVAGDPEELQIMYGVRGERRLIEFTLDHLSGYEGSRPVRVGNAASQQFQLDVYGEVMDAFHCARRAGLETGEDAWELEKAIVDFVCRHWQEPDDGIWEVRSGREHFVHSKAMAWVAVDRAIKAVEHFGKRGPVELWREVRDAIHNDVLTHGCDASRGCLVRSYGSTEVDASLLMLPLVGFLPVSDERMAATIQAVQDDLVVDGFVQRYRSEAAPDGLPAGEGTFLLCSFWLVDCFVLQGNIQEARVLFDRLVALANDVGLLSEEYDVATGRLVGNFPQAFSHIAMANAARTLELGGRWRGAHRGAVSVRGPLTLRAASA